MTLKIGWLHEAEQSLGTWLHEADDWHWGGGRSHWLAKAEVEVEVDAAPGARARPPAAGRVKVDRLRRGRWTGLRPGGRGRPSGGAVSALRARS